VTRSAPCQGIVHSDALVSAFGPRAVAGRLEVLGASVTTRRLASLEDLREQLTRWPDGPSDRALPTTTLAWTQAAAEAFPPTTRPFVGVASRDAAAAIAVMVERGVARRLQFPGAEVIGEPTEFPYGTLQALHELIEWLIATKRPIALWRVPAQSPATGLLARAARGRAWCVVRAGSPSPVLALQAGGADPMAALPSRKRNHLRRMLDRARALGTTDLVVERISTRNHAALLDDLWRVEDASWKGRRGTSLKRSAVGKFFRRYALLAGADEVVTVTSLRIDGGVVAAQLGVTHRGRYWTLKSGFDESYEAVSPGYLVTSAAIRHAAAEGCVAYEFLGDPTPFKSWWTRDVIPNVNIALYPYRSAGSIPALAGDVAHAWLARLRGHG